MYMYMLVSFPWKNFCNMRDCARSIQRAVPKVSPGSTRITSVTINILNLELSRMALEQKTCQSRGVIIEIEEPFFYRMQQN